MSEFCHLILPLKVLVSIAYQLCASFVYIFIAELVEKMEPTVKSFKIGALSGDDPYLLKQGWGGNHDDQILGQYAPGGG